MADFTIKEGDRLPLIRATLRGDDGAALDLSGCTVKFNMALASDLSIKVNTAATITSPTLGQVEYAWAAIDTDTAGDYIAEWEITYTVSTKKLTVPNGSNLTVKVFKDLA